MDKVQKLSNSERYIPLSEPFKLNWDRESSTISISDLEETCSAMKLCSLYRTAVESNYESSIWTSYGVEFVLAWYLTEHLGDSVYCAKYTKCN
jgi:hypothetical protein